MKERGMIFNAEMVRAILDGRKTQTRRIIKSDCMDIGEKDDGTLWPWREHDNGGDYWYPCPFGEVGDRLWVRETWARYNIDQESHDMAYRATTPEDWPEEGRWRPSIHMPRWASRITLEITAVRVEQLKNISETDAMAEGCPNTNFMPNGLWPSERFARLWMSIYGAESWQANPWCWVIEFRRLEACSG